MGIQSTVSAHEAETAGSAPTVLAALIRPQRKGMESALQFYFDVMAAPDDSSAGAAAPPNPIMQDDGGAVDPASVSFCAVRD